MTIDPLYLAPLLVLGFATMGYALFAITDPRPKKANSAPKGSVFDISKKTAPVPQPSRARAPSHAS